MFTARSTINNYNNKDPYFQNSLHPALYSKFFVFPIAPLDITLFCTLSGSPDARQKFVSDYVRFCGFCYSDKV